jgi:hypothetical protein
MTIDYQFTGYKLTLLKKTLLPASPWLRLFI